MKISGVKAREILDCRGIPTVQVDVWVDGVLRGSADVPSGRSTGSYEAHELRDGGSRYHGLGVLKAVHNVNQVIAKEAPTRNLLSVPRRSLAMRREWLLLPLIPMAPMDQLNWPEASLTALP